MTEADHFAVEAAMHYGFEIIDDDATTFSATAEQIAALVAAARTQGRKDVVQVGLTEAQIEAACRAAVAAWYPNADPDLQVPAPPGQPGTCAGWEAFRRVIEPALKAALGCDTSPAGYVSVSRDVVEASIDALSPLACCAETDNPDDWVELKGPAYRAAWDARHMLRVALDRAAPQSQAAQTPAVIFGDPAKPTSRCSYPAPQSQEAK